MLQIKDEDPGSVLSSS